ncbi:amino acid adenylation domain-containing protein [Ruegeria sp. 2205SS24-7]|uniref:non-ribosomal peptide synthetase n=1 Tax=Ruegeria discodermiae TaxID=3064389 RepID=UPI002741922A|nr:non-ribosomal peptide synthetase [Ruegeria sp. 2205SS24-7]MDP5218855.1 amino acid adenylation domain-containing protein [Ruegeria sp. 2205SS24-7]
MSLRRCWTTDDGNRLDQNIIDTGAVSMIRKEQIADIYPLSPMQEAMVVAGLRDPDSTAYVQQLRITLNRDLNQDTFKAAWQELVDRHTILRTAFILRNTPRFLQAVLKQVEPDIATQDLTQLTEEEQAARIEQICLSERIRGFDLTSGPPSRIRLIRRGPQSHVMIWTHHHVLLDGWCLGLIAEEFFQLYAALRDGHAPGLGPARPYSSFVKWVQDRPVEQSLPYWKDYLAGYEPMSRLPTGDTPHPAAGMIDEECTLDHRIFEAVNALAARLRVTKGALLHAAWGVFLAKYSDTDDALFTSVIANRPPSLPGAEQMIGLLINAVPVRVRLGAEDSFAQLAQQVQADMLARAEHEHVPLATIQGVAPQAAQVFDTLLIVQNYPLGGVASDGLSGGLQAIPDTLTEETHAPLTLNVSLADGIHLHLSARPEHHDAAMASQMIRHFAGLLERLIDRADDPLITQTPLGHTEALSLSAPPDTQPIPASMAELLAGQVTKTPDATALTAGAKTLSYAELSHRADRLAAHLSASLGLRRGDKVGLMLPRGSWLVTAMLALIRMGVAYVPLGPRDPAARTGFVLIDAGVTALITAADVALPDGFDGKIIRLGEDTSLPDAASHGATPAPDDLIYIAYTSGSTGQPKGVEIAHRNVAAFTETLPATLGLRAGQRILGLTTHTFDISFLELISSLALGLEVVLADDETAADPIAICDLIKTQKIDVLQTTPSRLRTLVEVGGWKALEDLNTILVGGEALPSDLFDGLRTLPETRSINVYGPTETTIWSTAQDLSDGLLCIGRPFPGEAAFVSGRNGQVMPVGAVGELCITGAGLGRGYHQRPDLTAERFADHPFVPAAKCYRTGDLARRRTDGRFEVLGRLDDQVKLRGHRIELGEIESTLRGLHGIEAAVVLPERGASGETKALTAYVVCKTGTAPDGILGQLASLLPAHMIPGALVPLDRLPLMPSGKIDRSALRQFEATAPVTRDVTDLPRDETEQGIARIIAEVLDRPVFGRSEDFFVAGGHSLLTARVIGRIRRDFGCSISIREYFAAPTVAGLAKHVRARGGAQGTRILPAPEAPDHPLTPAQRQLYVLDRIRPGRADYIVSTAFLLEGPLDLSALQRALDGLVLRHEALRTAFVMRGDTPRQMVQPVRPYALERRDVSDVPTAEGEIAAFAIRSFDLADGYLSRALLLRIDTEAHVMGFALHHIIGDAISLDVIARDLSRLYNSERAGRQATLKPLALQQRDIAHWIAERAESPDMDDAASYWADIMKGPVPRLDLPLDRPRPATLDDAGGIVSHELDPELALALQHCAQRAGISLFALVTAITALTLTRWSAQDEVILGTAVAGRDLTELEPQVGLYVNMVPLRLRVAEHDGIDDFLSAANAVLIGALEHQHYPYDQLIDRLQLDHSPDRTPLVEAVVGLQRAAPSRAEFDGLSFTPLTRSGSAVRFDLTFDLVERGERCFSLDLSYRKSVFSGSRAERLAESWRHVAEQITSMPGHALSDLAITPDIAAEGAQVPKTRALTEMFADQVARTPSAIALVEGDRHLTYQALNDQITAFAQALIAAHGVAPGDLVGLLLPRSADAVIALLAIQYAGAAYVPLDPKLPDTRLEQITKQAGIRLVVTDAADANRARGALSVDVAEVGERASAKVSLPKISTDDLAYVLFTSGTTGQPKGVMIEHRSVANLILWMNRTIHGGPEAQPGHHAALAALSFDVSVHEIYAALLFGHTLHIVTDEVKTSPRHLSQQIERDGITSLSLTPSLLSVLLDADRIAPNWPVRTLLMGAEELPLPMIEAVRHAARQPDLRIFNLYGPSETCVDATWHEFGTDLSQDTAAPIGVPIDGAEVLICDPQMRALPPGAMGQICISGPGLARAYLNAPDLTNAAFVPHPMRPGTRLYCTGDFGYRREDGVLMFAGRRDHQVKVRGHRIELLEIERQLATLPDISSVVVTAPEGPAGRDLVAYVAAEALDIPWLRQKLAEALPAYMVPEVYVRLDRMPLNASGKIDRARLPAASGPVETGTPPRPGREAQIAAIWSNILGTRNVKREDEFFRSGGHSLAAIRLLTALERDLGVAVPLPDFFRRPTVSGLAELSLQAGTPDTIPPAPIAAHYPLSPAQRRLWVLNEIDPTAYLLNVAVRIDGPLCIDLLARACAEVGKRHFALGTRLVTPDGIPRQIPAACPITLIKHVARGWSESRLLTALEQQARKPFDLETGPPLRLQIWDHGDDRALFLLSLHHIVGDGWSLNLILSEICTLYDAFSRDEPSPLLPLTLQAHDIAVHEDKQMARLQQAHEGPLAAARAYWHEKLDGGPTRLDLPADRPRPRVKTSAGHTIPFRFHAAAAESLCRRAETLNGGLFPLLTALVKVLLHRYTGEQDIWLGTAIAARQGQDRAAQVGFHVDTVVLRDQVSAAMPFDTFLGNVAETIAQATAHAAYPIDALIDELDVERDTSRAGLFDAMIVYNVAEAQEIGLRDVTLTPLPLADDIARFDLTVHITRDGDALRGAVEYNTDLFDADRMDRLIAHLQSLAASITTASEAAIGALELIPQSEQAQLDRFSAGPSAPLPTGTIPEAVWAQAGQTPQSLAIAGPDPLSYAELKSRAQALGRWLVETGQLAPGEAVGVCMERGTDLIVALLAVMEAGGVYLPLEPDHPKARIDRTLAEAGCRLVLSDAAGSVVSDLAPPSATRGDLTLGVRAANALQTHPDCAYLIFTSGSTGRPKGVRVSHGAFLNMVAAQNAAFGLALGDRVLFFASPAFDASLAEIFTTLTSGATLVPATAERVRDGANFASWMTDERISVATLPPAYLAALRQPDLPHLRVLITAGEAPLHKDVAHYAPRLSYFNAYGPTENAVCSTIQRVTSADGPIPIGRPIANTKVLILDDTQSPVPIGVPGEICLAGASLALGYLDPAQTAARFVKGPDGMRLYRTGDLGCWTKDGTVLYAGRDDAQVKIRGQRIEPGEVAAALETHPDVQSALALVREDMLCAYVVGHGKERELRRHASTILPSAMVPSRIVTLKAWPLTSSGKIDQAALPAPASPRLTDADAPKPGLEQQIASVWMQVLGRDAIGRQDDLFDLGADSLKIVLIVSALKAQGIAASVTDLYLCRSVELLVRQVESAKPDLPVAGKRQSDVVPVTAIQNWFFARFDGDLNHFNQAVTLRLDGSEPSEHIRANLVELARKHPALCTRFRKIEGAWHQDLSGHADAAIGTVEHHRTDSDAAVQDIAEALQRALTIDEGRLMSAARISHETKGEFLVLIVHHLAVDGYSWRLILKDLNDLMAGKPLTLETGWSISDLANAETELRGLPALERESVEWRHLLDAVARPPWARNRPCSNRSMCNASAKLPAEATSQLLASVGPGMESLLLSAFASALRRALALGDLLFLLEGHGRAPLLRAADLSETVGWCTAIYPVALPASTAGEPDKVADAIAAVPSGGAGFLRLLAGDAELSQRVKGAIVFNYLGEFGTQAAGQPGPVIAGAHGTMIDPAASALAPIDGLALVQNGQLSITLRADPDILPPDLLNAVVRDMLEEARSQAPRHQAKPAPQMARPYDVPPVETPTTLNTATGSDLFAMPPLLGYGAAFSRLANALEHTRLHAFDFIETEDRMARYVDAITFVTGDKPIRLLGLSGGALLAFEVTKALEARGYRVADLILLDTPANLAPVQRSTDEIEAKIQADLSYLQNQMAEEGGTYQAAVNDTEAQTTLIAKMRRFIEYLDPLVTSGTAKANIHQIRSEQHWEADAAWSRWRTLTCARFQTYQGSGQHADMLDQRNGPANARIIEHILQQADRRHLKAADAAEERPKERLG